MKLGLLTDIHEHVKHLRTALKRFQTEGVDQIVLSGDAFEMGERIEETCQLLTDAKAIGVWGNHDFGLCVEPDDETRAKYSSIVIDYMTSLRPRLDVVGCHFTHVEPWLNPNDIADLWYFEGPPDQHGKLERIFSSVPNRVLFAGHFHKWLLAKGPGHFALGIDRQSLDAWRERLTAHGVFIEEEIEWPSGGKSIYFRDPAGNSVELLTPGVWGLPSGW